MDWIQELMQKESLYCSLTAFLDQHGFSGLEKALQLYSNTQAEYRCFATSKQIYQVKTLSFSVLPEFFMSSFMHFYVVLYCVSRETMV